MNKYFIIYAEGNTIVELQEEINKLLDQDFVLYGFPFANNGKNYQCMKKDIKSSITSSIEAYQQYMLKKNEKPFKPPPIGHDRANG